MGYHTFSVPYTPAGEVAYEVQVEVAVLRGIPHMEVLGATDRRLRESVQRVRSALVSRGYKVPPKRIVVNTLPTHLCIQGDRFDLAIAYALIQEATGERAPSSWLAGSLRLDGSVIPCPLSPGELALTQLPILGNGLGGTWLQVDVLGKKPVLHRLPVQDIAAKIEVVGQADAKRVLSAAKRVSLPVLLIGPPGYGKTLLSTLFQGPAGTVLTQTSTASEVRRQLAAGCKSAQEIHLWRRDALASLQSHLDSPKPLIATANRCLCGRDGMTNRLCICSSSDTQRFASRLSEPLLDRFAAVVSVGPEFVDEHSWISKSTMQPTRVDLSSYSMRKQFLIRQLARGLATGDGAPADSQLHIAEASTYADAPW